MDSPFIAGAVIIAIVFGAGFIGERWSWAKPIAIIGTLALIVEALWLLRP